MKGFIGVVVAQARAFLETYDLRLPYLAFSYDEVGGF